MRLLVPDDSGETRRLGRYLLCERLSECYFGSRWSACISGEAEGSQRLAIRCIRAGSLADDGAFNRLVGVAFWAMEVQYDRQPAVIDVVVTDEHLGIVSPLFEGETLGGILQRARGIRSRVPAPVAVRIALDLLEALKVVEEAAAEDDEAQVANYAHGGVHPDSIHVGVDGTTRLLDTAVAAVASRETAWANHPLRIAYCAPEESEGEGGADERSDTFVVGVLMAEMLAGERIFVGDTYDPTPLPRERLTQLTADESLVALLRRAIDPDLGARFQRAADMAGAIRDLGVEIAQPEEVARFVTGLSAEGIRSVGAEEPGQDRVQDQEEVTSTAPEGYPENILSERDERRRGDDEDITRKVSLPPRESVQERTEEGEGRKRASSDDEDITRKVSLPPRELAGEMAEEHEERNGGSGKDQPAPEMKMDEDAVRQPAGADSPSRLLEDPSSSEISPPSAVKTGLPSATRPISTKKIREWSQARYSIPSPEEPATEKNPSKDIADVPLPPFDALQVPDWLKPESEQKAKAPRKSTGQPGRTPSEGTSRPAAPTEIGTAARAIGTRTRAFAVVSLLVVALVAVAVALFSLSDRRERPPEARPVPDVAPAVAEMPRSEPSPRRSTGQPSAAAAPAASGLQAAGPTSAVSPVIRVSGADEAPERIASETTPASGPEHLAAETAEAAGRRQQSKAVENESDRESPAVQSSSEEKRDRASRRKRSRSYIPDDI